MKINNTAVALKPKRFLVSVPQQLYDVLDALADLDGHDCPKALVEQLISDYCSSKIIELRDDKHSTIQPIWEEMFDQDLDDETIKMVCKL